MLLNEGLEELVKFNRPKHQNSSPLLSLLRRSPDNWRSICKSLGGVLFCQAQNQNKYYDKKVGFIPFKLLPDQSKQRNKKPKYVNNCFMFEQTKLDIIELRTYFPSFNRNVCHINLGSSFN